MTTYSEARAQSAPQRKAPARVIALPPSCFADEWRGKPQVEVAVGLRLVSESTVQVAKIEATRQACGFYEGRETDCLDETVRLEAYNDALIRHVCARAMTDPNDVDRSFFATENAHGEALVMAEESIRHAMTSPGIGRVWDEYVRFLLGSANRTPALEDAGVEELARTLAAGVLRALPADQQTELRKLLAHVQEAVAPFAEVAASAGAYALQARD